MPQLTFSPESATPATGGEPPPFYPPGSQGVHNIVWRDAMKASLLLAIPAGLMCLAPGGSLLSLFWMAGAAVWAVSLYSKRTHVAWISSGVGARIGLITGLIGSWLAICIHAVGLWMVRFQFHEGGQIDSLWNSQIQNWLQLEQRLLLQSGESSADVTSYIHMLSGFISTPEARAGSIVGGYALIAAFLVLMAMAGGALGARFLTQPRRPRSIS
ncbi:hypothetical protein ACFPT7_14765 [Acidicapsa dinghuensis]|uniref:DUF4199 domain-containing protein n=1 Tax=Acidicapsa dinghuensis TaxID=2218256 RepID=A0ABW1EI85_9BACT